MKLICETNVVEEYLLELEEVDYNHPLIQDKAQELFANKSNKIEIIHIAFEFVRDVISHSWDIHSTRITNKATEVLEHREGICYAKSNLLAALLRSKGIPTGFCYQKLTIGSTPDTGYCIHGLNAVYIRSIDRWIRLDARGNKEGVNAQFSLNEEKLAFPVREYYGEIDYPVIFSKPNEKTIKTLKENTNCINMYLHNLPNEL
ncbi:transglutaminase-like domain-containing protein [Chengkuizengella axinellae]|uniref:Transglutaminase family protein n=1 Tax=Chengkuizengella axinellae TaxID=3064388 RepID=A0ABT9IY94_9BACL|nr:transglutaminase family protein [Chengkuizengella sp. 2205SS18-9]MDP5274328.1 transglutaminase family protein [Chengkuizengella sp. 2205SS18-9]